MRQPMKCRACSAELEPGDQFCAFCGRPLAPRRRLLLPVTLAVVGVVVLLGFGAAAFRKAVALKPEHPGFAANLADTLRRQGKDAEAEPSWRRAAELSPGSAAYRNDLGPALLGQGRNAEAEAAFREAIQRAAHEPVYRDSLGNALYRQGKYREAEAAYHVARP